MCIICNKIRNFKLTVQANLLSHLAVICQILMVYFFYSVTLTSCLIMFLLAPPLLILRRRRASLTTLYVKLLNIYLLTLLSIIPKMKRFMCLFFSQRFVIEVKTKGGSKYLIYRRYREFFDLHHILESKYSPENIEKPGPNTCILPSLPGECFHTTKHCSAIHSFQRCLILCWTLTL